MKVQVFGPGCTRCRQLAANARAAIEQSGLDCELEHVDDVMRIAEMGILLTPALAIDGQIKSSGKVLTAEQIAALLKERR